MDLENVIFEIISNSGVAKSLVYEAIKKSEIGEFEESYKLLKEADDYLIKVHNVQTEFIQKEASGEKIDIGVLFVHAQDHLMSTIEIRNLAESLITMNKRLYYLESKSS